MKITVVGTGAFGIAMAYRLNSGEDNEVLIWSESQGKIDEYAETGAIGAVLGGRPLPDGLRFTTSMEEAVKGSELVFILTASPFVRSVCEQLKPYLAEGFYPIVGSKGVCPDGSIPANAAMEILGCDCGVIAGPGFAEDILEDCPVGFTFATISDEIYDKVASAYAHDRNVVIDRSSDAIGVSLCSCIKNATAVACGALSGAGHLESTICLLVHRAVKDLSAITAKLPNGSSETPYTLAGIGDLMLTCFSSKSRNCSFGYVVGQYGFNTKQAQGYLDHNTVEGMTVIKQWSKMAESLGIESPFMNMMQKVFSSEGDVSMLIDYALNGTFSE